MAKKLKRLQIDHQDFQHLVVVARLMRKSFKHGKLRFLFSDHTSDIEMLLNVDDSGESSADKRASDDSQIGKYFFVAFTPRVGADDETKYFIDALRPLADFNEISKHQSDVIVAHLERVRT